MKNAEPLPPPPPTSPKWRPAPQAPSPLPPTRLKVTSRDYALLKELDAQLDEAFEDFQVMDTDMDKAVSEDEEDLSLHYMCDNENFIWDDEPPQRPRAASWRCSPRRVATPPALR